MINNDKAIVALPLADALPGKKTSSVLYPSHSGPLTRAKARQLQNPFHVGKDLMSLPGSAPLFDFGRVTQDVSKDRLYKQSDSRGKEVVAQINKNAANRTAELDRLKVLVAKRTSIII